MDHDEETSSEYDPAVIKRESEKEHLAFNDLVLSLKELEGKPDKIASAIQTALYRDDACQVVNELKRFLEI